MAPISVLGPLECRGLLDISDAVQALRAGHALPAAKIEDSFVETADGVLLSRAASIDGLGQCVKSVTVRAGNPRKGLPTVQGALMLFEPATGGLLGIIDSRCITNLKTVADSLLGSDLLARSDARRLLIIGTGSLAAALAEGYAKHRRGLTEIAIFGRDPAKTLDLVARLQGLAVRVVACKDLNAGVAAADIISTATTSCVPVFDSRYVKAGTHLDLVGAYRADMREADDAILGRARIFVDSRQTTLAHIGEIAIPMSEGTISPSDIRGDYYDLLQSDLPRSDPNAITLCKNGGGAHLDLMIAHALFDAWESQPRLSGKTRDAEGPQIDLTGVVQN